MQVGMQIPDYTWPGGPGRLGADLAAGARAADDAGFAFISWMDRFFQITGVERPGTTPGAHADVNAPIMIGGGGERKTLRFVARYAQACNLFPTPDLAHKLEVLRAHCDAEERVYDEIRKSCYFVFDVGPKGEKANEVVDRLGELAAMGFDTAIGAVVNVWEIAPLQIIGSHVIPAG